MIDRRLPTYADVERAAERIRGVAHATPVMTSRTLDRLTGAQVFLKCENLQRAGAFKFRGAYNAVAALSPTARARGVVAFSSGNHAQAIALAGRLQDVSVLVVMPEDAPAIKIAAAREYGAQVQFYDRYTENREAIGAAIAEQQGRTLIPSYDHPEIIAGQGTATRELIAETGPLDVLLVALGGGGLLAGACLSAAALSPGCAIYGVEPEAGDDGRQSLQRGEVVYIPTPRSLADGAVVTHLGDLTFPIIRDHVADILTTSDPELVRAMAFLAERLKIIVEPTGCLPMAVALGGALPLAGKRVGVILSGGNIDLPRFADLITQSRPTASASREAQPTCS